MSRNLVIAAVLVVVAALPSAASAHRTANHAEQVAIARAAGERRTPLRCLAIDISTIAGRYAGLTFNARSGQSCARYGFNGIAVLHRTGTGWHQIWAGSEGSPPIAKKIYTDIYAGLRHAL
jgi:hypothetical protein